jgi:hypothetical protein
VTTLRGEAASNFLDAIVREKKCADFLIPEKIPMRLVLHAKSAKGGSIYQYRNDEHGIDYGCTRKSSSGAWSQVYSADELGDRTFNTSRELRCALAEWRQAQ